MGIQGGFVAKAPAEKSQGEGPRAPGGENENRGGQGHCGGGQRGTRHLAGRDFDEAKEYGFHRGEGGKVGWRRKRVYPTSRRGGEQGVTRKFEAQAAGAGTERAGVQPLPMGKGKKSREDEDGGARSLEGRRSPGNRGREARSRWDVLGEKS